MRGARGARRGVGRAFMGGSIAAWLFGSVALGGEIPKLRSAREGARERLGHPECEAVLTDFRDVTGRRLDEVLRASGRTAQDQLDLLAFRSGLGRGDCERGVVLAFTRVRSSEVSICPLQFRAQGSQQQEAALIHEMLHSLGLGENPPESTAITARVMKRCEP